MPGYGLDWVIGTQARTHEMKKISEALVKTWLFLLKTDDPELKKSKYYANKRILRTFGSVEVAEIYLEQIREQEVDIA